MRLNKWLVVAALALLVCGTAYGGDPLDTNDGPKVIAVYSIETACGQAERWPECQPCWTNCYYAIMAEAWINGWDFN